MVLGKESQQTQDLPIFVPPRKRQASKKSNGHHNYVDHIVNVQSRSKQAPTSPTISNGGAGCLLVEESLLKSSSLLLKKSIDNLSIASESCRELNAIRPLAKSNDHALHELHQFDAVAAAAAVQPKDTPSTAGSSCYSAESILDSNRSHDCLTGGSLMMGRSSSAAAKSGKKSVNYKAVDYYAATSTDATAYNNVQHHQQQHRQQQHHQNRSCTPQSNGTCEDLLLASGGSSSALSNTNNESLAAHQQHVPMPMSSQSSSLQKQTMQQPHNHQSSADGGRQLSFSRYTDTISSVRTDSYLTMTGTVKRGRKKGQSVDLQINMSRDELEKINAAALALVAAAVDDETHGGTNGGSRTAMLAAVGCCRCSRTVGLHVLLLSVLCMPFVTLATGVYSFYMGTLTWYNMFNYVNEERSVWLRVLLSPLLVVAYPVLIVLCTLGLAVYAGVIQLSVRFHSWLNEIGDVEKGFYGWLCGMLRMSDCSPYEVVVLVDLKLPMAGDDGGIAGGVSGGGRSLQAVNSSTEELSL